MSDNKPTVDVTKDWQASQGQKSGATRLRLFAVLSWVVAIGGEIAGIVLLYRHKEKNFRIMEYECQVFKEKLALEGKRNLVVVEDNYAGPFVGREFHPNEKK